MILRNFIKGQKAQALLETVIIIPIVLIMIVAILQFSIIATVHLTTNYSAYRAGRAVYLSLHNATRYGQRAYSARRDAQISATSVFISAFRITRWALPYCTIKLYEYNPANRNGYGREIRDNDIINPDTDIWVVVTGYAKLVMPLGKLIFGKGIIPGVEQMDLFTLWYNHPELIKTLSPCIPVKASYLVHTPHPGETI